MPKLNNALFDNCFSAVKAINKSAAYLHQIFTSHSV